MESMSSLLLGQFTKNQIEIKGTFNIGILVSRPFAFHVFAFLNVRKKSLKASVKKKNQNLPYYVLFNMHDSTYSFMTHIIYLFMHPSISRLFKTLRHMLKEAFTITAVSKHTSLFLFLVAQYSCSNEVLTHPA